MTPRRGPRPLLLHLSLATLRALAAMAPPSAPGSTSSSAGWPRSSRGRAEAARILGLLAGSGHPPEALRAALVARLLHEQAALLAGIAAYRRAPATPAPPPPPACWSQGASRLLDYGGAGAPAVFVPSLVNRAQILDLLPEHSMLRHLAGNGVRPLLLDWGAPGAAERRLTLGGHVRRLEAALDALPAPAILVGYCMGGLLALAAAVRRPERVRGLALLATPWDFHAELPGAAARIAASLALLEPVLAREGVLPVAAIQTLFAILQPFSVLEKFTRLGAADACPPGRLFVAIEDWLNDGVPLAAPVARACLRGWYGQNLPATGRWRVGRTRILPAAWTGPAFLALPERDRVVPPASARSLAAALPGATLCEPRAGHVGMVAGRDARQALWDPLLAWMQALPARAL